jgi:phosphatidylglycerol---prolipoprotein diacylglyceryl transferase
MLEILGINFYAYGLLIGLGIWMAMEIALSHRGEIKKEILEKAIWWTVISGVLGARIYHIIDFWGTYYSTNIVKIFYFWEGGLGIWGAIAGGMLGMYVFCRFNKLKFTKVADSLVIGIPLAQTVGRIGNYINGELTGKNGEPLFAYEGILNLVLFGILWKLSRKQNREGVLSGIYLVGYGIIRMALENLRPTENIWRLCGIPMAIIFGVLAILFGAVLIFRKRQS